MKIKLKVGRKIFDIGKNDVIFSNGACYQISTQIINSGFHQTCPIISKTQVKSLLKCGFIYTNDKLKELAIERYHMKDACFYRFNVELMSENGYEVVN